MTTHAGARTGADAIWAEGLTKTFKKTRALRGVDLRVRSGTVTALLGRNGAGKTTALRILTTLLLPTPDGPRWPGSTSSATRSGSGPGSG